MKFLRGMVFSAGLLLAQGSPGFAADTYDDAIVGLDVMRNQILGQLAEIERRLVDANDLSHLDGEIAFTMNTVDRVIEEMTKSDGVFDMLDRTLGSLDKLYKSADENPALTPATKADVLAKFQAEIDHFGNLKKELNLRIEELIGMKAQFYSERELVRYMISYRRIEETGRLIDKFNASLKGYIAGLQK